MPESNQSVPTARRQSPAALIANLSSGCSVRSPQLPRPTRWTVSRRTADRTTSRLEHRRHPPRRGPDHCRGCAHSRVSGSPCQGTARPLHPPRFTRTLAPSTCLGFYRADYLSADHQPMVTVGRASCGFHFAYADGTLVWIDGKGTRVWCRSAPGATSRTLPPI